MREGNEKEMGKEAEGTPMSAISAGRARINSMAISLSKKQEVAAPMAVLFLRRKSAMFSSHDFAPLLLGQTMDSISNEIYDATLVVGVGDQYVRSTQLMDYMYRKESIGSISLLEFVSEFMRIRGKEGMVERVRNEEASDFMLFEEGHPLVGTHLLRKRSVPCVPDIIGPRIPDRESLNTNERRERYGMMALILVFPFRNMQELRQGNASFWESFQLLEHSGAMNGIGRTLLASLQEYYESKRRAGKDRAATFGNATQIEGQNSGGIVEPSNGDDALECLEDLNIPEEMNFPDEVEMADPWIVASRGVSKLFSRPVEDILKSEEMRACFKSSERVADPSPCSDTHKIWMFRHDEQTCNLTSMKDEFDEKKSLIIASRNQCVEDYSIEEHSVSGIEEIKAGCRTDERRETIIEHLHAAMLEVDTALPGAASDSSVPERAFLEPNISLRGRRKRYPAIEDVCESFALNDLQKVAFKLASKALLSKILEAYSAAGTPETGNGTKLNVPWRGGRYR